MLTMSTVTPFQTVGPYWSIGLRAGLEHLPSDHPGAPIIIRGRLIDGAGIGIPDGLLEWWHPALPCVQRSPTENAGSFSIETLKAPHLAIRVLGRGILTQYVTRLYFADDPGLDTDPVLQLVPPHRRHTLLAQPTAPGEYAFDVVVQGDNETVFFET
jgi:protocatechuate 3,4-dioxygenase alpha subunit